MESKACFKYTAEGNLASVVSGGVYAGSVAVSEYYLKMDGNNDTQKNWLPTDMVFIIFKRPDGQKGNPLLMSYHTDGYWYITTNGWETDVDIGDNVSSLAVSFSMRRYTRISAGRAAETRPTEMVDIPLYPSNKFTPLELVDSEGEAILEAVETVQSDIGDVNSILAAIVNGTPFEVECGCDGESGNNITLIDNLTTASSGVGALDARQGKLVNDSKADKSTVNELSGKVSTLEGKVTTLEGSVGTGGGGGGGGISMSIITSLKDNTISYDDARTSSGVSASLSGGGDLQQYKMLYFRYIMPLRVENLTGPTIITKDDIRNGDYYIASGFIPLGHIASGLLQSIVGNMAMTSNFTIFQFEGAEGESPFNRPSYYLGEYGKIVVTQKDNAEFDITIYSNTSFWRDREKFPAYIEFYGIK